MMNSCASVKNNKKTLCECMAIAIKNPKITRKKISNIDTKINTLNHMENMMQFMMMMMHNMRKHLSMKHQN